MLKAVGFISVATSIYFLFLTLPQNSFYHSLFISESFSNNESISHHLYMLTRRPHIAGSEANAEAAAYVLSTLTSYGVPSHIAPYYTALTYPVSRSLTLTLPPPQPPLHFTLRQEIYDGDPYADVAGEVEPTFHGYAKSGSAAGPAVYVNYGRVEDYATLAGMGVNVSGAVVLARYGEIYRGDIVLNAQAAGAVGALIYTDRKDYGGEKWFPDDKWMPPSGVQVGSVYTGAGDPTTPGWPSTEECERISEEEVEESGEVPLIPSLPISWADGEAIIRSIGGQVADEDGREGKGAGVYRVGPGPGVVNLSYQGKQVITKIENVIGIIQGGVEPDRFVILGNHRDAWTFGAADPNSGTACLLEVAQRMWKLQKKGWKPRRTIIFCNWDAEEYGLIGSVEWVEENRQMLESRAVAYLNVDVAVAGAGFDTSATPQLDELLVQSAKQVLDPDNSSQTIYDSWISLTNSAEIGRLGGAGSDYSAFVQHIGVPSADIAFGGSYPVYHSMYDDFVWMSKFGDPMFRRHAAVASIWGLVALRLADDVILPFNYLSYAHELQKSVKQLEGQVLHRGLTLVPMINSINEFKKAAIHINDEIKALEAGSWTAMRKDGQEVSELNDRLMMAERAFTDPEGLKGRPWYKHLIYAPAKHNDYGSTSFPGISDAIEKAKSLNTTESWHSAQHEIWRVSRVITQASLCLKGDLT
ncbi:LOW QUALITY PROTEIN: probable glutamate carboxypeptidase LAMP1 [Salvia miltiorrhiza]|uniref:LOW QUALITY PROTEIN: probable glutamate carboxypeptidase LAMP1 n=1 Tax=Salvia miltiorrhiza TaxID=226208 RepID=UPI0025ACD17E|nr:LOW QUALITY PROTEIN: probable glutamate carboxypeptidase LAMP1 [Salvia miltiorrhiza]